MIHSARLDVHMIQHRTLTFQSAQTNGSEGSALAKMQHSQVAASPREGLKATVGNARTTLKQDDHLYSACEPVERKNRFVRDLGNNHITLSAHFPPSDHIHRALVLFQHPFQTPPTAMASFASSTLTHAGVEEMLIATIGKINGLDTDDNEYSSIQPLWNSELRPIAVQKVTNSQAELSASQTEWYSKAFDYWESDVNCPITDDGVLGGYGSVTPMDTRDSNWFLDSLLAQRPGFKLDRVADCGAGIGRVAKNLLLPRCGVVDLVEQSPRLLNAAPAYLSGSSVAQFVAAPGESVNDVLARIGTPQAAALVNRVGLLNVGLQDFAPLPNTYDLIWIQWVIGHLHDLDCITFFRRCAEGLNDSGLIVLKDNVLTQKGLTFLWDLTDSSVARHKTYFKLLLSLAGLQVVHEKLQTDFPEELFPVMMWAIAKTPMKITA